MSEKLNFRKIVAYLFCITLIAILLRVCRNQNHVLKAVQTFYSARLFLYISWGGGWCVFADNGISTQKSRQ